MSADHPRANIIIGTAGHVDHGKTSLIERLTGINADRLAEEQARGLTIDLGFAWFTLPSGIPAGIVDVPGHERFVKNMLAGATGIDLFVLVVAADEGVMPQTREHLTILDVLEIETGLVVITKSDMVDPDMIELVQEDIADSLKGTPFEKAPMVVISVKTGAGLDELVARLDTVAAQVKPRDITGPVRLQVDRSFTIRGFGTVVTGTLSRGRLHVDQELEIAPAGTRVRVRNLEVYEQHVDEVAAPARVGVNLAGVSKEEVQRGDQLIEPGSMSPSWMLDVRLRLAPGADRPLQYRERVRIHHSASEILGRVVLMGGEILAPGQDVLAQLRLEAPAVAAPGDHFVIRRYSPPQTIGGGIVLDPTPRRHRRSDKDAVSHLETLEAGDERTRAGEWLRGRRIQPAGASDIAQGLQLDHAQAETWVDELLAEGVITQIAPGRYLHTTCADELLTSVTDALAQYHAQNSLRPFMPMNRLQSALSNPPAEVLQWALGELRSRQEAVPEGPGWRLSAHELTLSPEHERAVVELEEEAARLALTPMFREAALEALAPGEDGIALLEIALDRGKVVPVGDFIMSRAALADAARALAALFAEKGPLTVADVRDTWGSSRKFVVPILEHLDSTGFTRRAGNERLIARPPGPREGVD